VRGLPDGMPGGLKLRGFKGIIDALEQIEAGAGKELDKRLREIGDRVSLVAAHNAPRASGYLQNSIRSSYSRGKQFRASIYSTAPYGGAQNYGAWSPGRGPHITQPRASHYMDHTVDELEPWVREEMDQVIGWVIDQFAKGGD
jgi:hypothetical protein